MFRYQLGLLCVCLTEANKTETATCNAIRLPEKYQSRLEDVKKSICLSFPDLFLIPNACRHRNGRL
jgi:hypothetical protein